MKKKSLLLIFVIFTFFNSNIFSQSKIKFWNPLSNSILLNLEGGSNYNFSDYEKSDLGYSFGGSFEYYFPTNNNDAFGLGLSLSKAFLKGNTNNLGLKSPADVFNTESTNFGAQFIYSYAVDKNILPFLSAGISYMLLAFESENISSSFVGFDLKNGADKSNILMEIDGGLKYKFNEDFDINVKVGYNYLFADNIDAVEYGDYNDFYFNANVGVSFRIYSDRDTDGDGISDDVDNCPYEEEDIDGFQDEDGCPDLDNDGDGIEDLDDSCPNLKEDIDGFEDEDGCPDVDNDGDGILDDVDQCVGQAEVFNGYMDDDGCPDVVPEPIFIEPEPKVEIKTPRQETTTPRTPAVSAPSQFLIHSETTFSSNSSQIKSSAFGELNNIVNELKKYPTTNWRIEAHIDKQESSSDANRITKGQADAILSYFISKGLSPGNFEVIGFGDVNPIASNNTVYGRMKNKRIIIRKLN
ncbi:MAG: OmpA family protein [Ignavibacteriales bacterium]|nr:OmpA family protein [Ignavibacteriales bacterium]